MRKALLRLVLLSSLPLAGCASTLSGPSARCSQIVPETWEAGVEGADIPETVLHADGHEDAKPWQKGFVAQSGQLEKANGRTADTIHIVRNCERLINETRPRRKVLGIF